MSFDFNNVLNKDENDEEIQKLIAKAQEESLKYYNEIELPRLEATEGDVNNSAEGQHTQKSDGEERGELYDGPEAVGFQLSAGKSFIYPTNYPIRQYQASIVRTAIFKNTLVSLPTGLGKTFIAAVVMYNFYRWYPNGKVVFMAPTRPLVAQQTRACHHIMNIPLEHTTEMTGLQNAEHRTTLWREKRVFYLTPQVMVNDLKSKTCPASLIKCIVIDEAHRATKEYAYCQVLKLLAEAGNATYRVLGLSATPGNDINAVQQVIQNLSISALEMRGEDSLDVTPYTHSRSVETVVVDLSSNILRVREDLLHIYEKYAKRLKDHRVFSYNISTISKFQVLKACEKFRANPPRGLPPSVIGNMISDFTVCMSLAHSLELLQIYGLRAFHSYLNDDCNDKSKPAMSRLKNDEDLREMLKRLGQVLYPKQDSKGPYTWGHPKLQKLAAALTEHFQRFQTKDESTKAIVFCQYRVVVTEIVGILDKCKPLILAAEFIGQSGGKDKGMSQAKQLQIMKDFRSGLLNCLVATCVAEEGLDIGEVDLILLMEAHKSPVRLVQRLGRTGRKRKGRCIVLLTKGREEYKFQEAMATRKGYVNNIITSQAVKSSLCKNSPRMIPPQLTPVQELVHINATKFITPKAPGRRQADIRKCFNAQASSPFLSEDEFRKMEEDVKNVTLKFDKLPNHLEMWHRRFDTKISTEELLLDDINKFRLWNEWNREEHETFNVGHTPETQLMCHLLKVAKKEITLTKLDNEAAEKFNKSDLNENNKAESSPHKRKRAKKEIVRKKYGMDIRACMAGAAAKARTINTEEIIDIEDEEDEPDDVFVTRKETTTESVKKSTAEDDLVQSIFRISSKQFNEVMSSEMVKLPFENGGDMYGHIEAYMSLKKGKLKKSWNSIRVLPNLVEMFDSLTVQDILGINVVEETIPKTPSPTKDNYLWKIDENFFEVSPKMDDFVNIDELFSDDSFGIDISSGFNINKNTDCTTTDPILPKTTSVDNRNLAEKDPIVEENNKPGTSKSSELVFGNNSLFQESWVSEYEAKRKIESFNQSEKCQSPSTLSPAVVKEKNENSRKLDNSPPLMETPTKNKDLVENVHNQPSTSNMWGDTPDIFTNFVDDNFSSAVLKGIVVCSTPKPSGKSFKKNCIVRKNILFQPPPCISEEKEDSMKSDDSDFWNLSDLFDDEYIGKEPQKNEQNTTMLGITQMVSLIEKDKKTSEVVLNQNNKLDDATKTELVDNKKDINLSIFLENDDDLFCEINMNVTDVNSKDTTVVCKNVPSSVHDKEDSRREMDRKSANSNEFARKNVNSSKLCTEPTQKVCLEDKFNSDQNMSSQNTISKYKFEWCKSQFDTEESQKQNIVNKDGCKFQQSTSQYFSEKSSTQSQSVNYKRFKNKSKCSVGNEPVKKIGLSLKRRTTVDVCKPSSSLPAVTFGSHINNSKLSKIDENTNFSQSKLLPPSKKEENPTTQQFNSVFSFEIDQNKNEKMNTSLHTVRVDRSIAVFPQSYSKSTDVPKTDKSMVFTFNRAQSVKEECGKVAFKNKKLIDSDSSEDDIFLRNKNIKVEEKNTKKRKPNKVRSEFIEVEADVSGVLSTDDSDNSSLDQMDDSFINDQSELQSTQAHYLQSLRSPLAGKFKIPPHQNKVDCVFSQQVDPDSEYMNDSFCVDSEMEDEEERELSLLDLAEKKLELKKKGKRRRILEKDTFLDKSTSEDEPTKVVMDGSSPAAGPSVRGKKRVILSDSEIESPPKSLAKKSKTLFTSSFENSSEPALGWAVTISDEDCEGSEPAVAGSHSSPLTSNKIQQASRNQILNNSHKKFLKQTNNSLLNVTNKFFDRLKDIRKSFTND